MGRAGSLREAGKERAGREIPKVARTGRNKKISEKRKGAGTIKKGAGRSSDPL